MLSADDLKKLTELLGSNSVLLNNGKGKGKGKGKMTPQAKNQLLSQLSSHQKIQEKQKDVKDMTEAEKKTYREELKKRLHNKQDMFKQMRTNQNLLQKNLDAKIKKSTETATKEDISKALQMAQPVNKDLANEQNVETEEQVNTNGVEEHKDVDKLEDFIN
jgi:hypothetical protein